jgi:hypothetical protein
MPLGAAMLSLSSGTIRVTPENVYEGEVPLPRESPVSIKEGVEADVEDRASVRSHFR